MRDFRLKARLEKHGASPLAESEKIGVETRKRGASPLADAVSNGRDRMMKIASVTEISCNGRSTHTYPTLTITRHSPLHAQNINSSRKTYLTSRKKHDTHYTHTVPVHKTHSTHTVPVHKTHTDKPNNTPTHTHTKQINKHTRTRTRSGMILKCRLLFVRWTLTDERKLGGITCHENISRQTRILAKF